MDFAERYMLMKEKFIFVTGFFGAPIKDRAAALAAEMGGRYVSLDEEIEKKDGRSVSRICMVMGEHEYRNREYEILSQLTAELSAEEQTNPSKPAGAAAFAKPQSEYVAVACGDGVLLDEMSAEIISHHKLIIEGSDMSCEKLWQNAGKIKNSCHAFMLEPDEKKRRKAFEDLYERQRLLFEKFC